MRIVDLIHPHLGSINAVLDSSPGSIPLRSYFGLPEDVSYEQVAPEALDAGAPLGVEQLLVALGGPDRERHHPLDRALAPLAAVPVGGRAVLLFGWDGDELPATRVLAALSQYGLQLRRLQPLQYVYIRCGAVVERADAPLPLIPYLQREYEDGPRPDETPTALRVLNEHQVLSYRNRLLRARLDRAERQRDGALDGPASRERVDALEAERQQLESSRQRAEAELRRARMRIESLERSTAYQVGRTLTTAAKQPGRGAVRLPKRLWELYQLRGRPSAGASGAGDGAGPGEPPLLPGHEDRLFVSETTGTLHPRCELSLAGVWTDATRRALAPDCTANTLLPNDALLVLDRVEPHAVVLQASAFRPGQPWAAAGTSVGLERDRALIDLVAAARTAGIATVYWADAPGHEAPALRALAASCDLVVGHEGRWGATVGFQPGLQLAEHHAVDLPASRGTGVAFLGAPSSRRSPATRSLLHRALLAAGDDLQIHGDLSVDAEDLPEDLGARDAGQLPWHRSAALLRDTAVCISPGTDGPDDPPHPVALAALASGARVVSGPDPALERLVGDHVTILRADEDPAAAVAAARAAGPRDSVEVRRLLRDVLAWTVRSQLEQLRRGLALPVSPAQAGDVAVVLEVAGDHLGRAAEVVLAQTHCPAELLLAVPDADTAAEARRALAEVEGTGVSVRAFVAGAGGPAQLRRLAAAASSPWILSWHLVDAVGPHVVQDLVVAAQMGRPDAVGATTGDDLVFVDDLPLAGSLLRRDLIVELPPADSLRSWHRRGHRLLGVRPIPENRPVGA